METSCTPNKIVCTQKEHQHYKLVLFSWEGEEMEKRSKAELKALETAPILRHKDGYDYDITGKIQGVDYEINKDSLVTTNKREINAIKNQRKHFVPITERSPEEQLEIRRKGQAAQTEKRRQRKKITDICNELLSMSASDMANGVVNPELADKLKETDISLYDLMVAKMIEESLHGNVKAFTAVRDSAGDKPVDEANISADLITDADRELLRNVANRLGDIKP